jgi:hypothetical protein
LLAKVTFSGETASGWQQALFATPVAVAANTNYVISYLAPKGYYALDKTFAWAGVSAAPLHVAGDSPGVYSYGTSIKYPANSWQSSNYWVDVVFVPGSTTPPPVTYVISGKVTGSAATVTLSGTAGKVAATDSTGNYQFTGLNNGNYVVAPSQTGFTFSPSTTAVTINGASVTGINFSATAIPLPHTVTLTWTPSSSSGVVGYNVYRAAAAAGPYTRISTVAATSTSYVDASVVGGQTYFYVATAVDGDTNESTYSDWVSAQLPL